MDQLLHDQNVHLKQGAIVCNVIPTEKSPESLNAHPRQHLLFTSPEHGLQLHCRHWNVTTREYVISRYAPRDAASKGRNVAQQALQLLTKGVMLLFAMFFLMQFLFFHYLYESEPLSFDSDPLASSAPSILYSISIFSFRCRREWLLLFYQSCYLAFSLYFLFLYYYAFYRSKVSSESLLVIRGFGLQASVSFVGGRSKVDRFIPFGRLSPPYVIEALKGLQVHYFLIAGVQEEKSLLLFFPFTRPPRAMLTIVGRGIRRRFYSRHCTTSHGDACRETADETGAGCRQSALDEC